MEQRFEPEYEVDEEEYQLAQAEYEEWVESLENKEEWFLDDYTD